MPLRIFAYSSYEFLSRSFILLRLTLSLCQPISTQFESTYDAIHTCATQHSTEAQLVEFDTNFSK